MGYNSRHTIHALKEYNSIVSRLCRYTKLSVLSMWEFFFYHPKRKPYTLWLSLHPPPVPRPQPEVTTNLFYVSRFLYSGHSLVVSMSRKTSSSPALEVRALWAGTSGPFPQGAWSNTWKSQAPVITYGLFEETTFSKVGI